MSQLQTDSSSVAPSGVSEDTEYPQVAYVNGKSINIVASLWNSPETHAWKSGAVTRSNEEACMVAATATWLRWRNRMMVEGRQPTSPNFVVSPSHSPIWDNFSRLWHIELRAPDEGDDAERLTALCDDDTICIIHAVNGPHSRTASELQELDRAISRLNANRAYPIPVHIDAGTQGLLLPFVAPDLQWDFRLDSVKSISAYSPLDSEAFPGTGFVCWRDRSCVPDGMQFTIHYLGAEINQIGLNFSRPTDGLLQHYTRYIRLGYSGIQAALLARKGEMETKF